MKPYRKPEPKKPKSAAYYERHHLMWFRRMQQSARRPSVIRKPEGKYIPAGRLRNV